MAPRESVSHSGTLLDSLLVGSRHAAAKGGYLEGFVNPGQGVVNAPFLYFLP